LFENYLNDMHQDKQNSVIFQGFLKGKNNRYTHSHKSEEIVRDFIAGMTDQYFLRQAPENMRPRVRDYL